MAEIELEASPAEVGLDGGRLARIDRHFAGYVDDGRLPGWSLAVSRHGKVAHIARYGMRDREAELPIELDTIFRIYSMTKPITSVALMMLYEEGRFELKDSLRRYLPEFGDMAVYVSGGDGSGPLVTAPAKDKIRIWHLLSHTAGLTYGFHRSHPVDALYREAGFDFGAPQGIDLEAGCKGYASLPLLFEPGTEWNYSVATDVVGRLVEVLSGQSLDRFIDERILRPLGMIDSGFYAPEPDHGRLAALYVPHNAKREIARFDMIGQLAKRPPDMLSGGGGMVSTLGDYQRFVTMLQGGGQLDGTRIIGPRTLAFMASNHLPGGVDLEAIGRPLFSETTFDGVGFGLGFSVTIDPVKGEVPSGVGEYGWGGAASTTFWVDPEQDTTAIFMTQLLPSSTHPIRSQLKQMVSQAIVA